jgi:hypothetical protein
MIEKDYWINSIADVEHRTMQSAGNDSMGYGCRTTGRIAGKGGRRDALLGLLYGHFVGYLLYLVVQSKMFRDYRLESFSSGDWRLSSSLVCLVGVGISSRRRRSTMKVKERVTLRSGNLL